MILWLKVLDAQMAITKYAVSVFSNRYLVAFFEVTGPQTHGDLIFYDRDEQWE
jgi:hypothetical protein